LSLIWRYQANALTEIAGTSGCEGSRLRSLARTAFIVSNPFGNPKRKLNERFGLLSSFENCFRVGGGLGILARRVAMPTFPTYGVPGYQFDATPDLSQSAIDEFFAIMDKWRIPVERVGDLLGGMPRFTVYKLKSAAGALRQDELTRISYLVGIYKALHIVLPDDLVDRWVTQPNDNLLFRGRAPIGCAQVFLGCSRCGASSMRSGVVTDWRRSNSSTKRLLID
jgi:hypothetical protein